MANATPNRPWAIVVLSLVILCVIAAIAFFGWHYYTSPVEDRLFSAQRHLFGPTGTIGLGCGIAATALFLSNLFYLARKKFKLNRIGTLRGWLTWHVFSGLLGGLLVPLHSAFLLQSVVTQTAVWSLGIVLATGIIGRYTVRFIPRNRVGEQLDIDALEGEVMTLIEQLRPLAAGDRRAIEALQTMADRVNPRNARSDCMLFGCIRRLRQLKRDLAYLAKSASHFADHERLEALIGQARGMVRYLALARFATQMMDGWRLFHRVLALLFLLALLVHIVGVVYYDMVDVNVLLGG